MRLTPSSFAGVITTVLVAASTVNAAFDLRKRNNLVLYWGQNAHGSYNHVSGHSQKNLLTYCKDTNVDLISIGFVHVFDGAGGQPEVNFANSCHGYQKFPGTNLLWCPTIAADIQACQALGKKILISIGGGRKTYAGFKSEADAEAFANKIWNAFGKGWTYYRPFGDAVVDGFDLDIEHLPARHYEKFARYLRRLYLKDKTKKYFLTAAPQCMNPDKSLAKALTEVEFDAIFVQFYNSPSCAANRWAGKGKDQNTNSAFNFGMWEKWATTHSKNRAVKIFLALPASPKVAPGGGYVSKATAASIVADLARFPSFGGAALWDASEAWVNTSYLHRLKVALNKVQALGKRRSIRTGK